MPGERPPAGPLPNVVEYKGQTYVVLSFLRLLYDMELKRTRRAVLALPANPEFPATPVVILI